MISNWERCAVGAALRLWPGWRHAIVVEPTSFTVPSSVALVMVQFGAWTCCVAVSAFRGSAYARRIFGLWGGLCWLALERLALLRLLWLLALLAWLLLLLRRLALLRWMLLLLLLR